MVRETWLEAVAAGRGVLASPAVAARWEAASALPELSVRGLAGHLVRAVASVAGYLDAPAPVGQPMAAPAYFPTVVTTSAVDAPLNVAVRERGEAEGERGHAALVAYLDDLVAALGPRLAAEGPERTLTVLGGRVMRLDDYLVTRLVEVVVHTDDLAVSVGTETPAWPRRVTDLAIGHLVDAARFRHGDLAVLRALTRRERDAAQALRVF